ncbi:DUF938 domain-containing protein [Shewanella sp. SNU WT4]|uniref:DUF938 domain-containing protein n=1 Tax=Shewanella sp. SNU WT4 TaxID=2590015 RepID=UPI00112B4CA2|nr:DUF938 domain-containing protein [Shewanella sp. SNU WT4]QDF67365.1 DUF938 domain-containing protein [Shewanella sp. SNU WT4]
MTLPFSQSCENNKAPILAVIAPMLGHCTAVLEVGSGTGQHAAFFSAALSHIQWQCTEQTEYIDGLTRRVEHELRIAQEDRNNLPTPWVLDVNHWPPMATVDAIYSANTLHIMDECSGQTFIQQAAAHLPAQGQLLIYGPFKRHGAHTCESNQQFDQFLQRRDPSSGVRCLDEVSQLAQSYGLMLQSIHSLPANNLLVQFIKT